MKNYLIFMSLILSSQTWAAPFLIGGRYTGPNEFLSAVRIESERGLCTAAKIGPRAFLTAAHCVMKKNSLGQAFNAGYGFNILNHSTGESLTTRKSIVHPSYLSATKFFIELQKKVGVSLMGFRQRVSSDVAVILVKEFTDNVPIAKLDFKPVASGENMIAGGFGCESLNDYAIDIYKIGVMKNNTNISNFVSEEMKDISREVKELLGYDESFFKYNLGGTYAESKVSTCGGDSGGPLYRASNRGIIGVNSAGSERKVGGKIVPGTSYAAKVENLEGWLKEVTQNFGELDNIILQLRADKSCAAQTFYQLLNRESLNLCKSSELIDLQSSYERLNLSRLAKIPDFNLEAFNTSWRQIQKTAAIQQGILVNNQKVPEGFLIDEIFFQELISYRAVDAFIELNKRNLFDSNQTRSFILSNLDSLDKIVGAIGSDKFFLDIKENMRALAPLLKSREFWDLLNRNGYSFQKEVPGFSPDDLVGLRVPVELMKPNFKPRDLYDSQFPIKNMLSLKLFTTQEILAGGVTPAEYEEQMGLKNLLASGFPINQLKSSKIPLKALYDNGFFKKDYEVAGFSFLEVYAYTSGKGMSGRGYLPSDFVKNNIPWSEIEKSFIPATILKEYSYSELIKFQIPGERLAGFYKLTPSLAKQSNISSTVLYPLFSFLSILEGGYNLNEVHAAYCAAANTGCDKTYRRYAGLNTNDSYNLGSLRTIRQPILVIHQAGFTAKELHLAGFELTEIKTLNKSIVEYYNDEFTPEQLVGMGFKKSDIKKQLKAAGIEVKNGDF